MLGGLESLVLLWRIPSCYCRTYHTVMIIRFGVLYLNIEGLLFEGSDLASLLLCGEQWD